VPVVGRLSSYEMTEAASHESLSARLTDVRESLTLLADYL
jgi:hypothetical protein